jgi:hypothetical protein
MIVKLTQWRLDVRCISILKLRDLNPCYRRERSRRVVADNVTLSKRNRDSSLQEGNRIKQGFEDLAASIVIRQDRDRFTVRQKNSITCSKKKNKGLKNRAHPNKVDASAV